MAQPKNKVVPQAVRDACAQRGITLGEPEAVAQADMSSEGALQKTYLILEGDRLLFAVSAHTGELTYAAGFGKVHPEPPEEIGEVYVYALDRLKSPVVYNQVVGGLLVVELDGEETWLCRFSSTRMREMTRFADILSRRLQPEGADAEQEPGEKPGPGRHRPPDEREEDSVCPTCGMPYPEPGRKVCPRCMEKGTIMKRILRYFREYRWRVAVMLLCITASGLLNAIWPVLSGTVLYDKVLAQDPEFAAALGTGGNTILLLGLLVAVMVGTKLLQQITGILHGRMTAYMVPGVVCRIKNHVFSALQRLSIGFFTRRQTGGLMQRVNGDANEVMGFFIDGLPYLLFNVLTILATAVILFVMDWRLALVALFMLPPLFFISTWLLPRLWHAHGRRARVVRSLYAVLNDNYTGARVVKAFGREETEDRRFRKVNERVRDAEVRVVRYQNYFQISYNAARSIPNLLVWCIGALLILYAPEGFTYGKLISFTGYLGMLQGPMEFFSNVFQWWSQSMNSAQRIFEIIDAQPDVQERPQPLEVKLKGDIELRHVHFGYEPNKPVLKDVSFSVRAGEMLGIVGRSGAGKSTLVNLMSRLYDADSGEILLDGHDIRDLSFASLRGAVAMVSQETYIFMGTVAENIAYARPGATREEIVQASIAASAHSFICRLPDGYDTRIGSGGRKLSGGERQRISIARAILADPQILVLDEATASVDTETERAIQDSLDQLIQGRTTISIAHRLSTLRQADRLIVLENGELVESGTHAELIAQRGVYFKLLQLQSKALAMRGVGD